MSEHERGPESSRYASRADYCRIFKEDMHSLYLLSFMLTTNHEIAELCYLDSIEYVVNGNPVFKEWARSWCKRSVIQNAIRLVFSESVRCVFLDVWPRSSATSVIGNVTRLGELERFVFVMSVLVRYSDCECAMLLNRTIRDISDARLLALRTIGEFNALEQNVSVLRT